MITENKRAKLDSLLFGNVKYRFFGVIRLLIQGQKKILFMECMKFILIKKTGRIIYDIESDCIEWL